MRMEGARGERSDEQLVASLDLIPLLLSKEGRASPDIALACLGRLHRPIHTRRAD